MPTPYFGAGADLPADLVPIRITAGHAAWRDDRDGYLVPKKELIGGLRLLLDVGWLRLPARVSEVQALEQELRSFRVRITRAMRETLEHRDGAHDDLLFAVACGC